MRTDEYMEIYIKDNCKTKKEELLFWEENNLPFFLMRENYQKKEVLSNRVHELSTIKETAKIEKNFRKNNISALFFKGVFLGKQLYENSYMRKVGDIDIYVSFRQYELAEKILLNMGYSCPEEMNTDKLHHVVFYDGFFFIELHKSIIHPRIGINEAYLLNNCTEIEINGENYVTFNVTATFLHLLYHLYMDTCIKTENTLFMYYSFRDRKISKADRFIYRAYEIARFAEKYKNSIIWEEAIEEIETQVLRIIFKIMIKDILNVFPDSLPRDFANILMRKEYVKEPQDEVFYYIEEYGESNMDMLLSSYILEGWEAHRKSNVHVEIGESFIIADKKKGKTSFECRVSTKKDRDGIRLFFAVKNGCGEIYCSNEGDFDSLTSDGVHLILCSPDKYSYNSIFFFPKKREGRICIVPVDILNETENIIHSKYVEANIVQLKNGYNIEILLKNQFILANHLEKNIFLGVVISGCDKALKKRDRQIILSTDDEKWYDPCYFAKISVCS